MLEVHTETRDKHASIAQVWPSLLFALSLLPEGLGFRVTLRLTGSCRHRTTTVTKVSALYAKVMQDFGINHMNQSVNHIVTTACAIIVRIRLILRFL